MPEALERALGEATNRSVLAIDSLRKSLRRHVQSERDRGVALTQIEVQLRALIGRVKPNSQQMTVADGNEDLVAHVIKWSKAFYESGPSTNRVVK